MHLPPSHHHPDPLSSLAPHFLLHLPFSLPLLRIIQHTAFNPDARIFSTLDPDDHADPQQAWAAVYVERSRFPDTECWLFSTFESWVKRRRGGSSNGSPDPGRREAEARAHMLSVLNDVAVHSLSCSQTGTTLPTPNTPLILGTLNDALLPLLAGSDFPTLRPVEILTREIVNVAVDGRPAQSGTLSPLAPSSPSFPSSSSSPSSSNTTTTTTTKANNPNGGVILGYCNPILKFLIPPPPPPPSTTTTTSSDLPPTYTFTSTPLRPHDLLLAVSRSEIPRTVSGLAKLGGVGVRFAAPPPPPSSPKEEDTSQLIAWLFLSPDGSLQSLHVEPAHRGQGVAKAVCQQLMKQLREKPEEMGMRPTRGLICCTADGSSRGRQLAETERGDYDDDDDEDGMAVAAAMREVGAEGWGHSDVMEHNADGAGVARGIGGKLGWRVRWVGVDLERVRRVSASLSA